MRERIAGATRAGVLGVGLALFGALAPPSALAQGREPTRSLDEILRFAAEHAPAIRLATSRRTRSNAAREEALPLLPANPTLVLAAGPRANGRGTTVYDAHVALGQPIAIGGQRTLRLEAAERLREQLEAELAAARAEARRAVASAYGTAVVARARVELAEGVAEAASEMLSIAQRRNQAGEIGSIDVRLAEADAGHARQAALAARAELRAAELQLCLDSGWPVDSPPMVVADLSAPPPAPALATVLALASQTHPALRARDAARAEAASRAALEDSRAWPDPVLGVEFSREAAEHEPANYVVLGTLGVELPVSHTNRGERSRARSDTAVAQAEQEANAEELHVQLLLAHSNLHTATERLQIFAGTVSPPLEAGLALLERGFATGELSVFDVASARERLLQVQRDILSAYDDYFRARAELEYAAGTPLPIPPSNAAP